jgi:hypothetical protein
MISYVTSIAALSTVMIVFIVHAAIMTIKMLQRETD